MIGSKDMVCRLCSGREHGLIADVTEPPSGENRFGFENYHRELWQCLNCRHFVNLHGMDLAPLYQGEYRGTVYSEGLRVSFDKIMALPEGRSDNRQRARRIASWFGDNTQGKRLLDVGSGLAVFPAAMAELGFQVNALDPDPVHAEHAKSVAHAKIWVGSFLDVDLPPKAFDLITFNKVLEHVPDSEGMLKKARAPLAPGGVVYIELPDGEAAIAEGPDREEFLVEHFSAFSAASVALLAVRSGFTVQTIERVREPSGKYTLRAFLM